MAFVDRLIGGLEVPRVMVRIEQPRVSQGELAPQFSELNRVRGSKLTMIFQDPMTALTPHLKIGVQMGEVLVSHRGASWPNAQRDALKMLERVRVPDPQRRLRQYPHELHGMGVDHFSVSVHHITL